MESAVEVALPGAVTVARLMGSAEGFGSIGGGVGVLMREGRWHKEGACSSGGEKDDVRGVDASAPPPWHKITNSELCVEARQPSSLHSDDASNDLGFQNLNSGPLTLDLDVKPVLPKSCKMIRYNSGCTKRSGTVQMEVSKSKPGFHDVNGISPEFASSSASYNISEKNQMVKQQSLTSRRGDKKNGKVKLKNRCDKFSLKNGLVGFSSAAGGINFFGMYGLKPDVFDITKYVNEQSLDELLCGSYSCPSIAKDKGKNAANSEKNLLQPIRKACSVLRPQKILQIQTCAEIDNSCTQKSSNDMFNDISEEGQADCDKGESWVADQPSSDKVQESGYEIKKFDISESPLYQPKKVLELLALSPPKDINLMLSDASKSSILKSSSDPRLGKPALHQTGLPPFPWSHSFSGHSKLGSDSVKLSTSRTICQRRWAKVNNSTALQKGSADLLAGFESLTFDQSLVPAINHMPEHPESDVAPIEWISPTFGACSSSKVPAGEYDYSQRCVAAQTLLDIAAYLNESPSAAVELLKKPSLKAMKTSKLKGVERSDILFGAPNSTLRPIKPSRVDHDGFPSKKLKLSTDITNNYVVHTESVRKGSIHCSAPLPVKSPPRKLFRDSNAGASSYGINLVKKSAMMKPPRVTYRPSGTQQRFRKSSW